MTSECRVSPVSVSTSRSEYCCRPRTLLWGIGKSPAAGIVDKVASRSDAFCPQRTRNLPPVPMRFVVLYPIVHFRLSHNNACAKAATLKGRKIRRNQTTPNIGLALGIVICETHCQPRAKSVSIHLRVDLYEYMDSLSLGSGALGLCTCCGHVQKRVRPEVQKISKNDFEKSPATPRGQKNIPLHQAHDDRSFRPQKRSSSRTRPPAC